MSSTSLSVVNQQLNNLEGELASKDLALLGFAPPWSNLSSDAFLLAFLQIAFFNTILKPVVVDILFEVTTPLGVKIRTTKSYWEKIRTTKHPSIAKHEQQVKSSLKDPDTIRKSRQDEHVYLYYKSIGKLYVCVVTDHIAKDEGYIITAYLTDRIKEGEQIYEKTKDLL